MHTIAFTGSAAVGLEIIEAAARPDPGQGHLKRVIAEMGGKNCVIVDADADLDEAVPAIVGSAFAYAGQKCSAAARVLAHEAATGPLLERLAGAVELLASGPADDLGSDVPALIERAAQERVDDYTARAAAERGARRPGGEPPRQGWYSRPTLATGLPADSPCCARRCSARCSRSRRVPDVEAACDVVDGLSLRADGRSVLTQPPDGRGRGTPLAGGQPLRQPGDHRGHGGPPAVRREPAVRTGTKAGGPHYLLEFVEPRAVTENTVRHGLVADL